MAKKIVTVLLGLTLPLLLAASIVSPSAGIVLLPVLCAMSYYFALHAGSWFFAVVSLPYLGIGFCVHGFNPFIVAGSAAVLCLTVPCLLHRKLPVWGEIAAGAAMCALAVCTVLGITALCRSGTITDVIVSQYAQSACDPVSVWAAKHVYARITETELGHAKLSAADKGYLSDVMAAYSAHVARELDGSLWWYLTGFGAFTGGVAVVGAFAVTRCRKQDVCPTAIGELRLGRNYLFAAVIPALCFAFLAFYEPMEQVVRTVVNLFVTLPTALCGITLLYHTLMRAKGKARIATAVAFWAIMGVAAFFYEWGMLILGFVGLADVILNVRKLLDWALE